MVLHFAVTCTPWERGGAASCVRLEARRAAPTSDRVGVGLDEERGDLEWPRRCAGCAVVGGDDRGRVPAPVGNIAAVPLKPTTVLPPFSIWP